jgi:hypothetical protein
MTYYSSTGSELPSVTTLIGRYINKPFLAVWARDLMRDYSLDFEKETKIAADIGTMAHEMVELDLLGLPQKFYPKRPEDLIKHAKIAYSAWEKWKKDHKIDKLLGTEVKLISEKYGFGGTIDIPAIIKSKNTILDLKTSKSISIEYQIQIAAYGKLWDENNLDTKIERYEILRLDKFSGEYDYVGWDELEKPWKIFKHFLEINKLLKELGYQF